MFVICGKVDRIEMLIVYLVLILARIKSGRGIRLLFSISGPIKMGRRLRRKIHHRDRDRDRGKGRGEVICLRDGMWEHGLCVIVLAMLRIRCYARSWIMPF